MNKNIVILFSTLCICLIPLTIYAEPEILKIKGLYLGMPLSEATNVMARQFGDVKSEEIKDDFSDQEKLISGCKGVYVIAVNQNTASNEKSSPKDRRNANSTNVNKKDEKIANADMASAKVIQIYIGDPATVCGIGDMGPEDLMVSLCKAYEIPLDKAEVIIHRDGKGNRWKSYQFKCLRYGYLLEVSDDPHISISKLEIPKPNFN
jgi:hypothetical protein